MVVVHDDDLARIARMRDGEVSRHLCVDLASV